MSKGYNKRQRPGTGENRDRIEAGAIRSDTRAENRGMRHAPDRQGFESCGLIQADCGPKRHTGGICPL